MTKPTFAEYLNRLKRRPMTFEWGALLVYDRTRANRLLAQEHIERFDGGHWLRPVTVTTETEAGSWTAMVDLESDKPVLSFVNSNIADSKARLSMHMLGGTVQTLRRRDGTSNIELVGLSRLDPLIAPAVRMNIRLNDGSGGSITEKGRVTLDLAKGYEYTFEVSGFAELNDKVGAALKSEFTKRPVEERVWELNTLQPAEDGLKPTSFAVRTHSLARAGQMIASDDPAELEEGAVIVGVAFDGEPGGLFPTRDEDMMYLLPEPPAGVQPFSMNLLVGNRSWVKLILGQIMAELSEFFGDIDDYVEEGDFIRGIRFTGQDVEVPKHRVTDPSQWAKWIECDVFKLEQVPGNMSMMLDGSTLTLTWTATGDASFSAYVWWLNQWWSFSGENSRKARVTFTFTQTYELVIDSSGDQPGNVVMRKGEGSARYDVEKMDDYDWGIGGIDYYVRITTPDRIKPALAARFDSYVSRIEEAAVTLNVLRLNQILFRSEQSAKPTSLHVPGDLSMLGELAPTLTAFAVAPLDVRIAAGGEQRFTLTPAPQGKVTWQVDRLPGEEGPAGTIVDGVYKAPAAEQINGASLRAIVTARAGDHVSRAIVTVLTRTVSAYPLLQSAHYSPALPGKPTRYPIVAGSLNAPVQWALGAGSKGNLRAPTAEDADLALPDDKNVMIYEAPTHDPDSGATIGSLMQIDVVEVSANGQTEQVDIVIPWQGITAEMRVQSLEQGRLQLSLWVSSWGGGSQELPPDQVSWFVVKGNGAIDPDSGIYTPNGEGDYIIVAGVAKNGVLSWSYTMLPMSGPASLEALYDRAQAQCPAQEV